MSRRACARADLQPLWPPPDEGSARVRAFSTASFFSDSLLVVQIHILDGCRERRFYNVDPRTRLSSVVRKYCMCAFRLFAISERHAAVLTAPARSPRLTSNTRMRTAAVHVSCAVARPRVASSPGAKRAGVGGSRLVEAEARLFHYPTRRSTVARGGELSWDEAEEVLSLECVQQHRVCRHRVRYGDRDPRFPFLGERPPTGHRPPRSASEARTRLFVSALLFWLHHTRFFTF